MEYFTRLIGTVFLFSSIAGNVLGGNISPSSAQNLTVTQNQFIQAEQALKSNNSRKFNKLYDKLGNYSLREYLQRDRLLGELSRKPGSAALNNEIKQFLRSHNDQVVSRKLRYQWLRYLAKTRQIDSFLQFYQASTSVKLKCRHLQFRLERKQSSADIYPEIEAIWLTGRSLPKSCDKMIGIWQRSGGLNQQLIWQRMLLAAEQKQYRLVRYLNNKRPIKDQSTGELLIKTLRSPQSLLSIKFKQQINTQGQQIILRGLNRLAWQDPNKAIKAWKKFARRLSVNQTELATLKRSIGLSLAIEQQPEAKDWLMSLNRKQDASVDQWLLSSALNTQDWAMIEHITRQKNHLSVDVDKWRYWRAISTRHNGYTATSDWLLKVLSR